MISSLLISLFMTASTYATPDALEKSANDVSCVMQYLDTFYTDCGRYPTTQEGLQALISKPKTKSCKRWGFKTKTGHSVQPYITTLPRDTGGRPWEYTSNGGHSFKLISLGADGIPGGIGQDADISAEDFLKNLPPNITLSKTCPDYQKK